MKMKVSHLLEELKSAKCEIQSEKKMIQQASSEILLQEIVNVSHDLKIRSNNRKALENALKAFAEADSGKSNEISTDLKAEFNTSSSERQQEMKAQIELFYSDLVAEEKKLLEATERVRGMSSDKPDTFSDTPNGNGFSFTQ